MSLNEVAPEELKKKYQVQNKCLLALVIVYVVISISIVAANFLSSSYEGIDKSFYTGFGLVMIAFDIAIGAFIFSRVRSFTRMGYLFVILKAVISFDKPVRGLTEMIFKSENYPIWMIGVQLVYVVSLVGSAVLAVMLLKKLWPGSSLFGLRKN